MSLPKDRQTGRPRGFGFVTLSTSGEAQSARDALDGVRSRERESCTLLDAGDAFERNADHLLREGLHIARVSPRVQRGQLCDEAYHLPGVV